MNDDSRYMPPDPAGAGEPTEPPQERVPSWRTLVGPSRPEPPLVRAVDSSTGQPDPRFQPPTTDPRFQAPAADEIAHGTLGDEPMGGGPREEPTTAVPSGTGPADAPIDNPDRREQSTVSLGRVGEELFAWLKTLASAAVYATLIVTFGFQVARVEGQSMAPTLADQDRLIVNKLAYRLGPPQIGDIVMLYYPLNPDKSFVKRVIAEEGDQIRIVDGRVYRNDVLINDDYVPSEYRSHDDYGPEVVPQGYYFVMGDHRNNSSDSRHWKFVPKKYIIGKVQLRWWPIPHARIF
jgi:signal peptidase I